MIEVEAVTKLYDGRPVVEDVSMVVEPHTISVIVGTSGSGKTTLLRMINRLVERDAGAIRIDGEDNRSIPGYELRRRIGYAIQGHGLFPHRTVLENIATVPRLQGWDASRINAKARELLSLFQLDPDLFGPRYPHQLSGGEQQRVGVARALAAEPNILLMDEPFGALDPIIRAKAQEDLLTIQQHFATTIILVTHDMEEAFRLANRIAVMDGGRLLQYGRPEELVRDPATPFVEALIGTAERPYRLLALRTLEDAVEPGEAAGPAMHMRTSQKDALAELIWSGRDALPVVADDGRPAGRVTRETLLKRVGDTS